MPDGGGWERPAARDGRWMQTRRQAIAGIRMKHVWLLWLLVSATAGAETLHRCVEETGSVSYQAQICTHGMRLDRTIHYAPAPERAALRAGSEASRATRRDARSGTRAQFAGRSAPVVRSRGTPDRCRAAKLKRQNALERLGLQRTYAQLSKLDEPVRATCGGF